MAEKKKKAAGNATSTAAKKNNSASIIAEPIDIVNMTAEEIIAAAIGRLEKEDGEAKHDRYGAVIHQPVRDAVGEFCRQNAEFAQAVCQSDRHFGDCLKAVVKGVTNSLSDVEAYTRAVQFYFPGATLSVKMLIDVGDGVLNDVKTEPEAPKPPLEISLDNLLDW